MRSCVPILAGVDTLTLGYLAPMAPASIERLAKAKAEARGKREAGSTEPTIVELGGLEWRMRPESSPPHRFLLHRPDELDVRVAGRPTLAPGTPTVIVELRAAFLWSRGYRGAARAAQELARELLGSPAACQESVIRLDLCADFQGWTPSGDDAEKRAFVKRIRKGFKQHGFDRDFTGYSFGLGLPLQGRLYDKTDEIGDGPKRWFFDLWRAHAAYVEGDPVWRLELQARTEALDELGLRFDWVGNVEQRLDELWRYTFGHPYWDPERETVEAADRRALLAKRRRAGGELAEPDARRLEMLDAELSDQQRGQGAWISLRAPSGNPARAEWPIAPEWRALQRVIFADDAARRASRDRQVEVQIDNIRQQIAGLAASLGALSGIRPVSSLEAPKQVRNDDAIWRSLVAWKRLQEKADRLEDRDFAARVEEKAAARSTLPPVARVELPPAPWESRERTLRALPLEGAALPHRAWQDAAGRQLEIPASPTAATEARLLRADERELRRRLRFERLPHLKRMGKDSR